MYLLSKKTFVYAFLCLLVVACSVQGFYNYHNWRVRQWCDHFGVKYNVLGGPPKSWEWPWNWSMVAYVSISKRSRQMVGQAEESIDQYPEPTLEDVRKLIGHAKYLPRLWFVGIYIPFPFLMEDIIDLKKREQIVVYATTKFTDEEMNFIRGNMPNTMVSIKFVE